MINSMTKTGYADHRSNDVQDEGFEHFSISETQFLRAENISLKKMLQEANEKLLLYNKGIYELKQLLDTQILTMESHTYFSKEEQSILLHIMRCSLKEITLLLNISTSQPNSKEVKSHPIRNTSNPSSSSFSKSKMNIAPVMREIHFQMQEIQEQRLSRDSVTPAQNAAAVIISENNTSSSDGHCPFCRKYFAAKRDLHRHIRIHTGEKPFKCEECNRLFARRDFLLKHQLVHTGERPHKCEECGKCFTQRSNLNKHMLIHKEERKFICKDCGRGFHQLINRERHKQTHRIT